MQNEKMVIKGHTVKNGVVEGEALVTSKPFSFLGDYDMTTGFVNELHELGGTNISGKILVFPSGRGSTVGALIGYYSKLFNTAPAGMICKTTDPVIAINAVMNNIPMMDRLDKDPVKIIKTGDYLKLDADTGEITILKSTAW